jgi:hypothetical protein
MRNSFAFAFTIIKMTDTGTTAWSEGASKERPSVPISLRTWAGTVNADGFVLQGDVIAGGDIHIGGQTIAALSSDEKISIINWLSSLKYIKHHRDVYSKVQKDTGTWLLEKVVFLTWELGSESSILWLHGIRKFASRNNST